MAIEIIIDPRDEREFDYVYARYQRERSGQGDKFFVCVRKCLDLLKAVPGGYPKGYRGIRQASIKKFPYSIFYRYDGGTEVTVVALIHNRRSKSTIRRRLSK